MYKLERYVVITNLMKKAIGIMLECRYDCHRSSFNIFIVLFVFAFLYLQIVVVC